MGAAQTAAQALLGAREELLDDIVGAVDDRQSPAFVIAGHGMPCQPVSVAVQIVEDDALRLEGSEPAGRLGPLAQVLVVALQVLGDRLEAGSGGLGPEPMALSLVLRRIK